MLVIGRAELIDSYVVVGLLLSDAAGEAGFSTT
jgi:hypothetical protein